MHYLVHIAFNVKRMKPNRLENLMFQGYTMKFQLKHALSNFHIKTLRTASNLLSKCVTNFVCCDVIATEYSGHVKIKLPCFQSLVVYLFRYFVRITRVWFHVFICFIFRREIMYSRCTR
jgi:hypothetical protein